MIKEYFNETVGSDVYAHEVIKAITEKTVVVRRLRHKLKNRNNVDEGHDFYSDDRYEQITITLRNDGKWQKKGKAKRGSHYYVNEDAPYYYHDRSF